MSDLPSIGEIGIWGIMLMMMVFPLVVAYYLVVGLVYLAVLAWPYIAVVGCRALIWILERIEKSRLRGIARRLNLV